VVALQGEKLRAEELQTLCAQLQSKMEAAKEQVRGLVASQEVWYHVICYFGLT